MNWGTAMTDWMKENSALDDLFAEARRTAPEPSHAFLARVIMDAEVQQTVAETARLRPTADVEQASPARGLLGALRAAFGGWGPLGGMLTATVAGIWIGFAGADRLDLLTGGIFGATESLGTVSLLPDSDIFALAVQE